MDKGRGELMMSDLSDKLDILGETLTDWADSETVKDFIFYSKCIFGLKRLGREYNWVVITPDININICEREENEINDYFVSLFEKGNLYQCVRDELLTCDILEGKRDLLKQVFFSIENNNHEIACIALSTVLEFLLAVESDLNSIKVQMQKQRFISRVGDISISEYEVGFLFSLDGFLDNYTKSTQGFEKDKEPKFINRHWIAHGRMHRELEKIDTYQILFAIYAYVRVVLMEKRIKLSEE